MIVLNLKKISLIKDLLGITRKLFNQKLAITEVISWVKVKLQKKECINMNQKNSIFQLSVADIIFKNII